MKFPSVSHISETAIPPRPETNTPTPIVPKTGSSAPSLSENNIGNLVYDDVDIAIDCTLPTPNWTGSENISPVGQNNDDQFPILSHPYPSDDHSLEAKALLGDSVPHNTGRSSLNSLKALGCFCVRKFRPHRLFLVKFKESDTLLFDTRVFLFPDENGDHLPPGYDSWTEGQLKRVRFYLIEFVANYDNKKTGSDISPSTLKTNVLGIQRGFLSEWGYELNLMSRPIFNDSKNGLFAVLDNKAREQQRNGRHVMSHNVLSQDDLIKLYTSHSLSKDSAKGLQALLIFTVGILTAMRPSALVSLRVS